ncbi:hypothetical protein [Sphingomonas morindae]|uniref:Uncharacterized protein n=1 Tax=Sphingomonas morindae TaxID=1541170 RepID=A0ABY4X445_9SPHN|nr:hypothetical protein [Sphingomonas morindae]USI71626.1 hypothetical protein LHA26_09785 [Sphingomonas morindae]
MGQHRPRLSATQPVLPAGYDGSLRRVAAQLREGAADLRSGSLSRHPADHHHARIDAERLMLRLAERLEALA